MDVSQAIYLGINEKWFQNAVKDEFCLIMHLSLFLIPQTLKILKNEI